MTPRYRAESNTHRCSAEEVAARVRRVSATSARERLRHHRRIATHLPGSGSNAGKLRLRRSDASHSPLVPKPQEQRHPRRRERRLAPAGTSDVAEAGVRTLSNTLRSRAGILEGHCVSCRHHSPPRLRGSPTCGRQSGADTHVAGAAESRSPVTCLACVLACAYSGCRKLVWDLGRVTASCTYRSQGCTCARSAASPRSSSRHACGCCGGSGGLYGNIHARFDISLRSNAGRGSSDPESTTMFYMG